MLSNFFAREELSARHVEGQTMVEYALILVLVSVIAIAMLGFVGDEVLNVFTQIRDALAGGAAAE